MCVIPDCGSPGPGPLIGVEGWSSAKADQHEHRSSDRMCLISTHFLKLSPRETEPLHGEPARLIGLLPTLFRGLSGSPQCKISKPDLLDSSTICTRSAKSWPIPEVLVRVPDEDARVQPVSVSRRAGAQGRRSGTNDLWYRALEAANPVPDQSACFALLKLRQIRKTTDGIAPESKVSSCHYCKHLAPSNRDGQVVSGFAGNR
jgi:hypothetical protein